MTQTERLAKNPRLLFWGRALFDVKMLTAVVVLFYLHRGVTIDEAEWSALAADKRACSRKIEELNQ